MFVAIKYACKAVYLHKIIFKIYNIVCFFQNTFDKIVNDIVINNYEKKKTTQIVKLQIKIKYYLLSWATKIPTLKACASRFKNS